MSKGKSNPVLSLLPLCALIQVKDVLLLVGKLSDEYPCARVSVIFQFFLYHFVGVKLATSSIGVKSNFKNPTSLEW